MIARLVGLCDCVCSLPLSDKAWKSGSGRLKVVSHGNKSTVERSCSKIFQLAPRFKENLSYPDV